jgi:DnaJ homolog subfamily C member 19
MLNFLIGIAVVAGGLWLIRTTARLKPAEAKQFYKRIGGIGLLALAGLLMLRGNTNTAMALAAGGLAMIGISHPWIANWLPRAPQGQPGHNTPVRPTTAMSVEEAYSVLGLKPGATAEDVRQAHRRLQKDFHPDKGGSDYLAAKINQAKDVLLKVLG